MPEEIIYPSRDQVVVRTVYKLTGLIDTSYGGSYHDSYRVIAKNPRQRRKRPTDLLAPGSLTGLAEQKRISHFTGKYSYTLDYPDRVTTVSNVSGDTYLASGAISPPTPDWQGALRKAVKDQKVNLAQTLAEYRQTQNLFVSNANTIARAFIAIKRGRPRDAFEHLGVRPRRLRGTTANRWLELQYGWLPLLKDIYGSCEELALAGSRPVRRRVDAKAKAVHEDLYEPYMLGGKHYRATTAKTNCRVRAYVEGDPPTSTRLGFTNPAALMWELMPYSFVIDWLIPIGDWLNNLDAAVGITSCVGTVTTRVNINSRTSFGGTHIEVRHSRAVFDHLPSQTFPSWSPSLGFTRIANALALLSQLKR